jgi:hypothetical protein
MNTSVKTTKAPRALRRRPTLSERSITNVSEPESPSCFRSLRMADAILILSQTKQTYKLLVDLARGDSGVAFSWDPIEGFSTLEEDGQEDAFDQLISSGRFVRFA